MKIEIGLAFATHTETRPTPQTYTTMYILCYKQ